MAILKNGVLIWSAQCHGMLFWRQSHDMSFLQIQIKRRLIHVWQYHENIFKHTNKNAKKFEIITANLFGPVEGNSIILRIFHRTWNWNLYDSQVYCIAFIWGVTFLIKISCHSLNQIWIPMKSCAKKQCWSHQGLSYSLLCFPLCLLHSTFCNPIFP